MVACSGSPCNQYSTGNQEGVFTAKRQTQSVFPSTLQNGQAKFVAVLHVRLIHGLRSGKDFVTAFAVLLISLKHSVCSLG